ncbi:MAG: hypothetical protein HFJ73_04455 [Eggerthellaceae bacterium]|nr:hypothetical protein [Eggerthellaceae bacterium]
MADEQKTEGMSDEALQMAADGAEPDTHIAAEGTGPVAEDAETAPAGAAMTAEEAEVIKMAEPDKTAAQALAGEAPEQPAPVAEPYKESPGPQDDSAADRARVAAYDAHDTSDGGIDLVVVIVVLLVVLGCLVGSLAMAMNAPKTSSSQVQTKAEQEALKQAEEEAEANRIPEATLPEGVAAMVNGQEIPESEVTDVIEEARVASGLEDKDAWGQWMVAMGMTPDTLRESIIGSMVDEMLLEQVIDELSIEVTEQDVEDAYQETRAQYGTDEEWQQVLQMNGLTEETYREQLVDNVAQQKVADIALEESENATEVTDDMVLENLKGYYTEYAEATTLDEVDADIADKMRSMLENNARATAYQEYMKANRQEADLKMSKMPSDVPYIVFLLPYYFTGMLEEAGLEVSINGEAAE